MAKEKPIRKEAGLNLRAEREALRADKEALEKQLQEDDEEDYECEMEVASVKFGMYFDLIVTSTDGKKARLYFPVDLKLNHTLREIFDVMKEDIEGTLISDK